MKKNLIIAAIVIGVFVLFWVFMGAFLPPVLGSGEEARAVTCRANLQEIARQKEIWAYDTHQYEGTPTWKDLGMKPKCPKNGTYTINPYPENPTCTVGDNGTPNKTYDDHIYI